MSGDIRNDRQQGRLRRMFSRLAASSEDLQAEELRQHAEEQGCTPIASCQDRQEVSVSGTLRAVTLRPRAGVPALGRRSIAGIEPGRRLVAHGRISHQRGRRVLFNPRYELRPVGSE